MSEALVKPKWGIPFLRRLIRNLSLPQKVMGLILLVLLVLFVFLPAVNLFYTAFSYSYSDRVLPQVIDRGINATPGKFTLVHLERVFYSPLTRKMFLIPFLNTILITTGLTAAALSFGSVLAWVVVRTDLPGRKLIANLATIPYIIPAWPIALAWLTIFKNTKVGGSPGWFQYIFHAAPPDWISYGPVPIIICLTLHYYSYAFITVSGALATIDSRLEETGELLGASKWQVMRKITLPLVLPSILSAFILTFSRGIGSFGTPAFLGMPAHFFTLSTQLYNNVKNNLSGDAYIIALVMIIMSGISIYMNIRVIGARKSFVTISGKGFRAKPVSLGKLKYIILVLIIIFLIFGVFTPLYVLTWQSFMEQNGNYALSNFTLHFWIGKAGALSRRGNLVGEGQAGILRNPMMLRGAWNSIKLALIAAFFTSFLGILIGYAIVRDRGSILSKLNDALSFAPYIFPGIAFGAVYLTMFAKPFGPIPALYGTFSILVLVSVAKHVPYSSRTGTAAMMQVNKELEEAGELQGAKFLKRFTKIIFPLTRNGLVAGFMLSFITVMRELSLVVLLVTPRTKVLTTMIYDYAERGYHQFGDAITMLVVIISLTGTVIIRRFQKTDLAKGIGG
ncbi:MAG: iron ABC transporter permease [Spirochaetales bacterium]|nr:iron ABC transporter permease [Spirochaetales bacterium]